ncbi:MAG: hypothetical protein ACD_54C01021G0001 [uncultured bacterium]|nr:MAG: hypothetical protein ACD_54C01021G0001 [uncultured bacterium]
MLGLQAALQLVGKAADSPFQRLQLLIKIGAQPFQLGRFGEVFGADFFIEIRGIDGVVRVGIGIGRGRRWFQRRFAFGQFGLVALLHVGLVFHGDLSLRLVLLIFLALFGRGFAVFRLLFFRAVRLRRVLIVLRLVAAVFVVGLIGVVAQLVAIAKVCDHLAGKAGKGGLIIKHGIEVIQRVMRLTFDEFAPHLHDIGRTFRQIAPGGQMADKVARCD